MESKTELFIKRAILKHGNRYDYSKVICTAYNSHICIGCPIHGFFNQNSYKHIRGAGCPACARLSQRKTHEQYIAEVAEISSHKIEVLGRYAGDSVKITHRCTTCSWKWDVLPTNVIAGHGCPRCGRVNTTRHQTKTHSRYVEDVQSVSGGWIKVLGQYSGAFTKIEHECAECMASWYAMPTNILRNKGCPCCKMSTGERAIRLYLEKQKIPFEPQKTFAGCEDEKPLRFDFFLKEKNVCIEYDGEQHFKPIDVFGGHEKYLSIVRRDNIKNLFCKESGIFLLRIAFYDKSKIVKILRENLE